jgi:hypothetical protein
MKAEMIARLRMAMKQAGPMDAMPSNEAIASRFAPPRPAEVSPSALDALSPTGTARLRAVLAARLRGGASPPTTQQRSAAEPPAPLPEPLGITAEDVARSRTQRGITQPMDAMPSTKEIADTLGADAPIPRGEDPLGFWGGDPTSKESIPAPPAVAKRQGRRPPPGDPAAYVRSLGLKPKEAPPGNSLDASPVLDALVPENPDFGSMKQIGDLVATGTAPIALAAKLAGTSNRNLLRHAAKGYTYGMTDETQAALETGAANGPEYTQHRDAARATLQKGRDEAPIATTLAEIGGAVAASRLLPNSLPSAIAQGMASGFGNSTEESAGGLLKDTALGGGMGLAADRVGRGLRAVGQRLFGGVAKPSEAAKYLRAKGVSGLTLGQENPRGVMNQLEEGAQSLGGVGPAIQGQRQAGRTDWQRLVMEQAVPPSGRAPAHDLPLPEQLDDIANQFNKAYGEIKGRIIAPETSAGLPLKPPRVSKGMGASRGAMLSAVDDPDIAATPEQRDFARKYLLNQSGLLPDSGGVGSEVLLKLRSNIRAKAREVAQIDGLNGAKPILDAAEEAVTDALESQLPKKSVAQLRDTDAAYRRYKVLDSLMWTTGDAPDGFTPAGLQNAIRQNTARGKFARGGGPEELRGLARAGREVFDMRVRPTGERALVTGPLGQYITGPLVYSANTPTGQALMRGETALQRALLPTADAALPFSLSAGRAASAPSQKKRKDKR